MNRILQAKLNRADRYGSNLHGANLSGADLRRADLHEANFSGADLSGADLSGADLRRADLRRADLHGADLHGANLSEADLSKADLHGAYLNGANLSEADLSKADLHGAYLNGANLSGADLSECDFSGAVGLPAAPIVHEIDAQILRMIQSDSQLEQSDWHTCTTTHCRGGWAITLAGPEGEALDDLLGPCAAAALIYAASRPHQRVPSFYSSNADTLEDLRFCASGYVVEAVTKT